MAEPKKRLTSTRSGNRQSHDALKASSYGSCSNCKQRVAGHSICQNCGYYKGKKVLDIGPDKKKTRKEKEELKDE